MLSAIVYGRNDGYSYELNRRTALGLNQLARQLAPGRDEIVFVDYNTDNDLPTHPEAIADTLTAEAIDLIRVIRVRPDVHASLTTPGPPVREAICRNIAIRRLSPDTRWVLSTNPDCLLITTAGEPLAQLVKNLEEAAYGLPRFELPRFIWEMLPRSAPEVAAAEALSLAAKLNFEEVVRHYLPEVGYDAPGDFQLIPRAALDQMAGFDESMSFGWHVDSNMNARLSQQFGPIRDLNEASGGALKLFHAEHARRFSAKHGSARAEDRFDHYVTRPPEIAPPEQTDSWGMTETPFETFLLSDPPAKRILRAMLSTAAPTTRPGAIIYGPDSFNKLPRDTNHLFAFLIDHLAYLPPGDRIGLAGDEAVKLAALISRAGLPNPVTICTAPSDSDAVDVLILDPPEEGAADNIAQEAFACFIMEEWRRSAAGAPPRRMIGVNTPHSQFEAPFLTYVEGAMTPVTTRIRYGEAKPRPWARLDLMDHITPGDAGELSEGGVAATSDREGYAALVRLNHFPPGNYQLDYQVELGMNWSGRIVLDIALNGVEATAIALPAKSPGKHTGALRFTSGADGIFGGGFEFRMHTNGKARARLTKAVLIVEDD